MQPDVYGFAENVASHLQKLEPNYTVADALLVNAIVDFSSFCTSIIAHNDTDFVHVRNLDFDFPEDMQKLIYIQRFERGGELVGTAPSIAGFYGVYTGVRADAFSLSYNVRFTHNATGSRKEQMWQNVHLELSTDHKPF